MPANPHFGSVKTISSGASLLLIISFMCRVQWQPSSLGLGQSAGSQKERERLD